MPNLPIFERLDVDNYGLYPGIQGNPGLHIEFGPGLTLILGTNGLGKSTLISILYRLLTGPSDISGLVGRSELGNIRLESSPLQPWLATTFGQRVADRAERSVARLALKFGGRAVTVGRRLKDLSLIDFTIDGEAQDTNNESSFQREITRLVGVWSFGDWILLLRHLVFYFEDRRALVWDASAQRQLFRLLFLSPDVARKWTEDERDILDLDSRVRNLNAALTREERSMAVTESKAQNVASVREELKTLARLQEIDTDQLESLETSLVELDSMREAARLRQLVVEQDRESRFRAVERARLLAIDARFPSRSDTARYILAQLLTDNVCLVCGSTAVEAAREYARRIETGHCVVCSTDLSKSEGVVSAPEVADARLQAATQALAKLDLELSAAVQAAADTGGVYDTRCREIGQLNASIQQRSARIDSLIRQLPPGEAELHKQRQELGTLRSRVALMRQNLAAKRQNFATFVGSLSGDLVRQSDEIKMTFHEFSEGFLLEQCQLVWAPRKARVGETGDAIEFPAFALEMTGADFAEAVRRQGPDQVSESQREFIDLSFRMALIAVAGRDRSGTLIIDAPESSLDAVFAARAARVLARFARRTPENRLIVTSNLVDGPLIPDLLSAAIPDGTPRQQRIIDLFTIAIPTAAVKQLRPEYETLRDRLVAERPHK